MKSSNDNSTYNECISIRQGLCSVDSRHFNSNNQETVSDIDFRDLLNIDELMSDDDNDSDDSSTLAGILQKVLDIDDLLCFDADDMDDDFDETLPPELDARCDIMEPDIPHFCEVELPRPVNWQLRLLLAEEEEIRAIRPVQAAE
mmetsp:Transcript_10114/g.14837  ORF Transcript_10114/g.14837 Transcript_10114/m.14837 type:complete len:145 (+) Transcript_10114:118-552(+)